MPSGLKIPELKGISHLYQEIKAKSMLKINKCHCPVSGKKVWLRQMFGQDCQIALALLKEILSSSIISLKSILQLPC